MFAIPCATSRCCSGARADHAVRHDGAEQRLDRAEQRDGERRADQPGQVARMERRQVRPGQPEWIAPNRLPIVATGRRSSAAAAVPPTTTTSGPGTRRLTCGHTISVAIDAAESATAAGEAAARARAR